VKNRVGDHDDGQQLDTPPKKDVAKPSLDHVKTIRLPQEQGLTATGMQILGRTVYLHRPSGKLLLDVGQALVPLLSQIFAEQAINHPALGGE
jgi:hypothetical protein